MKRILMILAITACFLTSKGQTIENNGNYAYVRFTPTQWSVNDTATATRITITTTSNLWNNATFNYTITSDYGTPIASGVYYVNGSDYTSWHGRIYPYVYVASKLDIDLIE